MALLQIGLAGFAGLVDSPGVEVSLDASARQTRSFWLVAVSITTLVFFGGVLLGVVYEVVFPPPPPDHTPALEALADIASLERPKQAREGPRGLGPDLGAVWTSALGTDVAHRAWLPGHWDHPR